MKNKEAQDDNHRDKISYFKHTAKTSNEANSFPMIESSTLLKPLLTGTDLGFPMGIRFIGSMVYIVIGKSCDFALFFRFPPLYARLGTSTPVAKPALKSQSCEIHVTLCACAMHLSFRIHNKSVQNMTV